jgi:hypothetical protein
MFTAGLQLHAMIALLDWDLSLGLALRSLLANALVIVCLCEIHNAICVILARTSPIML